MTTALSKFVNSLATHGLERLGLYYSVYRGYVVEREDPDGYSRLKLAIPEVTGEYVHDYWAWPRNVYSGLGYGMQIIPNKGDMVFVEFERGNVRRPVWSFGHFGKKNKTREKPKELTDPDNFWFRTPTGHLIEFDDKNELIRLTTNLGLVYEMNEQGISLGSKTKSAEPAVKGDTLADLLVDAFEALINAKTATSIGPMPLLNVPTYIKLKSIVNTIKSDVVTLD